MPTFCCGDVYNASEDVIDVATPAINIDHSAFLSHTHDSARPSVAKVNHHHLHDRYSIVGADIRLDASPNSAGVNRLNILRHF